MSTALWQQLHAYMENRFGSSQISVTGGASHSPSHPVTAPHSCPVLPRSEPRRQKDKIKSDVPICPPSFFFIYLTWPLPYKHGLNMPYKLPRLNLIEAGIFVVLSDDSRFH